MLGPSKRAAIFSCEPTSSRRLECQDKGSLRRHIEMFTEGYAIYNVHDLKSSTEASEKVELDSLRGCLVRDIRLALPLISRSCKQVNALTQISVLSDLASAIESSLLTRIQMLL